LPEVTGTIGLITLKIRFVNLDFWGVHFLQGVRQTSCIFDSVVCIQYTRGLMALQIMEALLYSKNAKKGFIFCRLPEVLGFQAGLTQKLIF